MGSFVEMTRWTPLGSGRWSTTIDPGWHQGRGAFGGLLAGAIVHAMEGLVPDRALRTLHVHFCAPARGELVLASEIVRAGHNVSHGAARITDTAGVVVTLASAVLASDRRDPLAYDRAVMPAVPAWTAAPEHTFPPSAPRFVEHFAIRHALGTPFTSLPTPELAAWIALREDAPVTTAVMAGLVDVLPAGACALMPAPRAIASVDFTLQVLDATTRPAAPLLLSVRSGWARAGYTEELRELWTAEGTRIAMCRQLIALL